MLTTVCAVQSPSSATLGNFAALCDEKRTARCGNQRDWCSGATELINASIELRLALGDNRLRLLRYPITTRTISSSITLMSLADELMLTLRAGHWSNANYLAAMCLFFSNLIIALRCMASQLKWLLTIAPMSFRTVDRLLQSLLMLSKNCCASVQMLMWIILIVRLPGRMFAFQVRTNCDMIGISLSILLWLFSATFRNKVWIKVHSQIFSEFSLVESFDTKFSSHLKWRCF